MPYRQANGPEKFPDPADRVEAFLDKWDAAGIYTDSVFALGRMEGEYTLSAADLRALVATARRDPLEAIEVEDLETLIGGLESARQLYGHNSDEAALLGRLRTAAERAN